ncbi:MAG: HNH endonuclease family protein [Fusobacteriaceae bacterium]
MKIENEFKEDIIKDLKDDLMKYYPKKEEFIVSLKKLGYSNKNKKYKNSNNKKIVDYIFVEIENKKEKTKEKICETTNCSVEHILPDDEKNNTVCMIGNLLLIDKDINEKMKNKAFKEKIPFLEKSELAIVKNFIKYYGEKQKWTENDIEKRGEEIACLAYDNIWKV